MRNNSKFHFGTKYSDVGFQLIRKAVLIKQLNIVYIFIAEIIADGLTEDLPTFGFLRFFCMIGIDEIL